MNFWIRWLVGSGDEQRRGQNVTRHRIKTNLLAEAVTMSLLAFPIPVILAQRAVQKYIAALNFGYTIPFEG
jgi:hypothetical protein